MINGLNSHEKAHVHDGISIQMIKLCNLTITRPLSIIYKNCLQQRFFPDDWKKGNIILINKNSKQIVNNYLPVSLLPICSKIFKKLILDSIYDLTFSATANQESDLMILACISLLPLHITFLVLNANP